MKAERPKAQSGEAASATRNRPVENNAIEAESSAFATLRENGTGCRAEALPKVRTCVRRCARFSKVRILENPDVFFEDAQLFSKVRNFSCAPSRRTRAGVCERSASALRRRKNRQAWTEFRLADSQNRDLMRDLFRHADCRQLFWPQTDSQVARDRLGPVYLMQT